MEIRPSKDRRIAAITASQSQANPCPEFLKNLDITLTNCLQDNIVEYIILGDFNYYFKWDTLVDTHLPKESMKLVKYLNQHNLNQLNTHPSQKDENNILDLIITNLADKHSDVTCGKYKYQSDHFLLYCEFHMKIERLIAGQSKAKKVLTSAMNKTTPKPSGRSSRIQ